MPDTQITELAGRHFLISQLLAGGVEVAIPVRDRGVDLIAYVEREASEGTHQFAACPIQLKASTGARFELDRKYEKVRGLLLVYAWKVEAKDIELYALTYHQAFALLEERKHTATRAWRENGRYSLQVNEAWRQALRPHRMESKDWLVKVRVATSS